jgi:hypothetical protein
MVLTGADRNSVNYLLLLRHTGNDLPVPPLQDGDLPNGLSSTSCKVSSAHHD